jgi:hypothetical protein
MVHLPLKSPCLGRSDNPEQPHLKPKGVGPNSPSVEHIGRSVNGGLSPANSASDGRSVERATWVPECSMPNVTAAMTLIRIGAASRLLCESTTTTRRRAERGELDAARTADGQFLFNLAEVATLAQRLAAERPRRHRQVPA